MAIRETPTRKYGAQASTTTVRPVRPRPDKRVTTAQPPDFFHVARDEDYLRQLRAEEEFWDTTPIHIVDGDNPPPASMRRYSNEQVTGDSNTEWYDVIQRYGTFRRGLVLGTGNLTEEGKILRSNPLLHLTFTDISGKALAKREQGLAADFPGRVATQQVDLNFIELPKNAYDIIISDTTIHHLLNLEHIAYPINESLTPEGYFFYNDYVGEKRFQFAEEKKRLFEAVFREAQSRYKFLRRVQPVWSDSADWQHSPFEAIRSGDSLKVFSQYLNELSVRTTWPLLFLLVFLQPKPLPPILPINGAGWEPYLRSRMLILRSHLFIRRKGIFQTGPLLSLRGRLTMRRLLPDLIKWDRLLTEAGTFQPCRAFGIYQKRPVDPGLSPGT